MKADLEQLQEMQKDLFRQQCDLDIQKAMLKHFIKKKEDEQLTLTDVGISLPDLAECNQASLDYATKKNNPDFFLIKQTFKDGVNWALNYVTRPK